LLRIARRSCYSGPGDAARRRALTVIGDEIVSILARLSNVFRGFLSLFVRDLEKRNP
jgi:hypothetical protein